MDRTSTEGVSEGGRERESGSEIPLTLRFVAVVFSLSFLLHPLSERERGALASRASASLAAVHPLLPSPLRLCFSLVRSFLRSLLSASLACASLAVASPA